MKNHHRKCVFFLHSPLRKGNGWFSSKAVESPNPKAKPFITSKTFYNQTLPRNTSTTKTGWFGAMKKKNIRILEMEEGSWSKCLNGCFSSSSYNGRRSWKRAGTVACVTRDRRRRLEIGSVYLGSVEMEVKKKKEEGRKEWTREGGREGVRREQGTGR